jgi:hypothetical protein
LDIPEGDSVERLPFTDAEMERILSAAEHLKLDVQQPITKTPAGCFQSRWNLPSP